MKNVLSVLLMLMIISGAAIANVEKPGSTGMAIVRKGSTFSVFYKSDSFSDVKVSIRNTRGEIVFTETLKKVEGFIRPYNFSDLAEGEYSIEVTDAHGKQVEKVNYINGKVERVANVFHIKGEDQKIVLTVPNKGNDELNIKIFDKARNLVYEETEKIAGDFAKVYNLKNIPTDFTLEITDKQGIRKTIRL